MNHLPQIAAQHIRLQDTTKAERKFFVQAMLEKLNEGEVNPLDLHLQVKCMEEIIKTILAKDEYKAHVMSEATKHGSKTFNYGNAEVQIKEAGVKYDFSSCGDPKFLQYLQNVEDAQMQLEAYKDFLKTIPKEGIEVLHDDELITIYPPVKNSTTTVTINLK